jgi:hypothetical protein
MDFNPEAKPNRIANGDSKIHACFHHALETLLVDA